MKHLAIFFSLFLLSGILFSVVSCHKETDCKALVRCRDSAGVVVANAYVELYAVVKTSSAVTYTSDVRADGYTDTDGEVRFTFKLPAILDIRATLASETRTYTGAGIIKLEEGNSVEKEVTLR
jgi:hypothetical protein